MSTWLMHPDLPEDQWFEAPDESSAHYGAAGWVPVPADVLAARDADEAHSVASADARMAGLPEPPRPKVLKAPAAEATDGGPDSERHPAVEPDPKPAAKAKTPAKTPAKPATSAADTDTEGA